jgi:mannose-1-phosphate guanylyltransferase
MTKLAAMVLGAGLGTRLRPLTEELAKPACPVLGRPLIEFPLSRLANLNPRTVVVNLHHLPDTLRARLDPPPFGLPIETIYEPEILGTGGGLKNARAVLAGAEAIVLLNGDTICEADLRELVADHLASEALATLLLLDDPRVKRYGAVEIDDDGAVVDIAGLRQTPGARRGLFAGAHVLSPKIFDLLPTADVFCIVREAYLPLLAAKPGAVRGLLTKARFFDLGTPHDYLLAQWALLDDPGDFGFAVDGLASAEPGVFATSPLSCRVLTPVLVAAGARVHPEAELGPYVVVGARAEVGPAARLSHAAVWPGAMVNEAAARTIFTPRHKHTVGF